MDVLLVALAIVGVLIVLGLLTGKLQKFFAGIFLKLFAPKPKMVTR